MALQVEAARDWPPEHRKSPLDARDEPESKLKLLLRQLNSKSSAVSVSDRGDSSMRSTASFARVVKGDKAALTPLGALSSELFS